MSTELTTRTNELLASAGQVANEAAEASVFTDYRSRKASNTITHQDTDLVTFAAYLAQADELKAQPDTPQGRRDRLLVCLMLDLGLRRSEVAGLTVDCVDLQAGELTFYRQKVDKEQTHGLVNGLQGAMSAYLAHDAPEEGALLRSSRKGGHLTGVGMSERAITARVRYLGERIGITGLSAHDLRHTWATLAARNGTPLDRLQDAGGWASLAMPMRYVEAAKVANQGVVLE